MLAPIKSHFQLTWMGLLKHKLGKKVANLLRKQLTSRVAMPLIVLPVDKDSYKLTDLRSRREDIPGMFLSKCKSIPNDNNMDEANITTSSSVACLCQILEKSVIHSAESS